MSKQLRFAVIVLAVVGLLAALVALPTTAHMDKLLSRTVNLTIGDMFFQLEGQKQGDPITLKAGELVRFVIKNEGQVLHDLHFGKDADLDGRLYKTDMIPGFDMIEVGAGQSLKLTIKVPSEAGEWELACFQMGHFEAGQKAKVIINK